MASASIGKIIQDTLRGPEHPKAKPGLPPVLRGPLTRPQRRSLDGSTRAPGSTCVGLTDRL